MGNFDERLNDVEEASKRLNVSTFTTRRLIKAGALHSVRVGRRLLIPETEVQRVMREGCGKHAGQ
jgi:excisionase family DNA binding protein